MEKLLSDEPEVRLIATSSSDPNVLAVSSARSCYSSKPVYPEDVVMDERDTRILQSTGQAGHNTTRQHAYFTFGFNKVSRQALWSLFHSHPFYNSEQVSQRYVKVKMGSGFLIPPLDEKQLKVYLDTVNMQMQAYSDLINALNPTAAEAYFSIFPARKKKEDKYLRDVTKKSQEIARYALPIAVHAHLFHTINFLTLARYWKMSTHPDFPLEQRIIIDKMVNEMLNVWPSSRIDFEYGLSLADTDEYSTFFDKGMSAGFIKEFDNGHEPKKPFSVLTDWKQNAEKSLADAVRTVYGLASDMLSDTGAIEKAINPAENRLLSDTLNLTTFSAIARSMYHSHYTFKKKLSHTADSQDQRHRMVPASRPILMSHYAGMPDYIVPVLVWKNNQALELYEQSMEAVFNNINQLLEMGVKHEYASYLLPNAFPIRFIESGDLLNLQHKYKMRLCYNSQEEIWQLSVQEVEQIRKVHPEIGKYLLPPCSFSFLAKTRPICPEREHFCGVPVWKLDIKDYKRVI